MHWISEVQSGGIMEFANLVLILAEAAYVYLEIIFLGKAWINFSICSDPLSAILTKSLITDMTDQRSQWVCDHLGNHSLVII